MRKSLLLLATLAPLAAVAALAAPAIAQSGGGAAAAQAESMPLFADAMPALDEFAARGDEEDGVLIRGKAGARRMHEDRENGHGHENGREDD